jgi:hypothetical protein
VVIEIITLLLYIFLFVAAIFLLLVILLNRPYLRSLQGSGFRLRQVIRILAGSYRRLWMYGGWCRGVTVPILILSALAPLTSLCPLTQTWPGAMRNMGDGRGGLPCDEHGNELTDLLSAMLSGVELLNHNPGDGNCRPPASRIPACLEIAFRIRRGI